MAVTSESVNPLIDAIHERDIERPDSLKRCPKNGGVGSYTKREWHPVAAAVATLAAMLHQKGHRWNRHQKLLYRRAILSVKHPCCPTCGKPMTESVTVTTDGVVHKSWYCETDQNL